MMRVAGVLAVLLCVAFPRWARADQLDRQVHHLRNGSEFKLRLSAALKLAKSHDRRAVSAMSYALIRDSQATLRRVAALSLMKMVDESVPERDRDAAIRALEHAASRDRDKKVRENAGRTLRQLRSLRGTATADTKVFLNVGRPADLTRAAPRGTTSGMHRAVRRALRRHAPDYAQTWADGKLPTKDDLRKRGMHAYYVGASVSRLDVRKKGHRAEIKCTVSMRVNPWTGSDGHERMVEGKAASATGNGKVVAPNTKSGIASGKRDCLLAVVEQVTARQVVPFLSRINP
jgi:hypothetical protein